MVSRIARGLLVASFLVWAPIVACESEEVSPAPSSAAHATIGPQGGTVGGEAVSILVPAGALPADTTITITATDEPPPGEAIAYSRVVRFEPAGLVFAVPVEVTFAFRGEVDPTIYWTRQGSETEYDEVGGALRGGAFVASVTHFSRGFLGRRGPPASLSLGRDAGSDATTSEGPADARSDATTAPDGTTSDAAADASCPICPAGQICYQGYCLPASG
jgi:hypothetical protein